MAVNCQQPKTSPNDAFKLLGRSEALRKAKRTDGTRNATAPQRRDAQKKKLSSRQKIDTQISGSKIVNANN
jgi:hypothetical protein